MDLSIGNTANLVADRRIGGLDSLKLRKLSDIEDGILEDRLRESMKENRGMRAETARPGKRPLRALSAAEKMEAIQRVHDGESKASVARDIGVPESTLRGWCKSEHKIRGMARNSSTPDSEAHSPASSSGANVTNSQAGTSHSSEDEGPIQKRMKADLQSSVSHTLDGTENNDSKMDNKKFDYLGLMSMAAAGMRSDSSALLLQHLGMMSQSAKNYMMSSSLTPTGPVGLVENGLQYTKSGVNHSVNSKRHSICAIAPTQMDSMVKSVSRKSLPPAAEAPTTHVPASPNVQMSNVHLSNVQMSNQLPSKIVTASQLSNSMVNQLSSSMTNQLTNAMTSQLTNPMTSQLANTMSTQLSNQLLSQLSSQMSNQLTNVSSIPKEKKNNNNDMNPKKMDEALWLWLTQQQQIIGQQSTPFNPTNQDGSWFWNWYKHYGAPPPVAIQQAAAMTANSRGPTPVPQNNSLPRRSPSKAKAVLDSVLCNNNNESVKKIFNFDDELDADIQVPHTTEEAIVHGEKFFKWLDKCSDPAVTRVQVFQLRMLLDKLKDCKKKRTSPSPKQSRK